MRIVSVLRLLAGAAFMAALTVPFLVVCVLLLPSRRMRIHVGNAFGHIIGRSCLAVAGVQVDPAVAEACAAQAPAIFVSNHASILDILVGIWLAPYGTCGIGKKEVVWYPFFGLVYLLSGHLRIDRSNRASAVEGLRGTAALMKQARLGAWIWPEGTRAPDGRLLAFKKGFAHLALATRLPIVPVVVEGAHRLWPRDGLRLVPGRLPVRVLPPISTEDWTPERLDQHIAEVRQVFLDTLPHDQLPVIAVSA